MPPGHRPGRGYAEALPFWAIAGRSDQLDFNHIAIGNGRSRGWRHKHQWRFGATLNRFDVIAVIARENESEKTLPVAIKFADDMTFIAVGANTLQSRQHPVTDGQCLAAAFISNQQNLCRSRDGSFPCCGKSITIIGDRDDVKDSYRRQLIRGGKTAAFKGFDLARISKLAQPFAQGRRPSALIPKALAISLILGVRAAHQ